MSFFSIGSHTTRWNIRNKSFALMALFPCVILITAYWQLYFLYVLFHHNELAVTPQPDFAPHVLKTYGMMLPFLIGAMVGWFIYCLKKQDEIIARLFRGHQIERHQNPDLFNMVETLAIQLGLATPEIFLIKTPARNAMASTLENGKDRIYVTQGLLDALSKDEVEAVLAHEYAHIISEDTRWLGLSVIFTNIFASLPASLQSNDFVGLSRLNQYKASDSEGLFLSFILHIIFLPLWIGYLAVSIVRLLMMFQREFHADLLAAEITKRPDSLLKALQRVHRHARIPYLSADTMFLCIDNPRGGFFATHPRLSYRLRKIAWAHNMQIPYIKDFKMAPLYSRFTKSKLLQRSFQSFDFRKK